MDKKVDLIIVGAGPAGVSAAIYGARAKLKTLVLDSGESGGQIRITSEVVNYPGILNVSGAEFSDTMRRQAMSFGAEIIKAHVTGIDAAGDWKKVRTDQGEFQALSVIIATGANPRKAGFKGEEAFQGRGVGYCATCDGEFFTGLDVFVIGGGFAAAEEALFLTRYARKVTIVVRGEAFTCSRTIADEVMAHPKIDVLFQHELLELEGDQVVQGAVFKNKRTGETWRYESRDGKTFGVFVFAGYEPMSGIAKDIVQLDAQGYILTNEDLETNLPGIYAAGDIRPKKLRQLVTAVADGAVAATNGEKYITAKKAALGIINKDVEEHAAFAGQPQGASGRLLDEELKDQLLPIVERFERNIVLTVVQGTDNARYPELEGLAVDLAGMSGKISYIPWQETALGKLRWLSEDYPSILLLDESKQPLGVAYQAAGGHEFNSFILALYNAAGPGQEIGPQDQADIKNLDTPLHIQVGVTLSCTMCPDVVQGCQMVALKNPNVTLEVIDISQNAAFRSRHQIMSVPAMVVNGTDVSFGRKNLSEVVQYLKER